MSIRINPKQCISCGGCVKVCPGSLIDVKADKKAYIKYPKDCWGCTACLKECPVEAISYFLGPDIGGAGGSLKVRMESENIIWKFTDKDKNEVQIEVNRKESNRY